MLAWGAVEKKKEISVIFLLVKPKYFWCSSVADDFVASNISIKDTAKYKKLQSAEIVMPSTVTEQ